MNVAPALSAGARRYLVVRHLLELCVIALVVPFVLAMSLVVATAVWLEDRGPVFFVQWRVGYRGLPFPLVKFRTMRAAPGAFRLTAQADPRITRVGRVLRRSHLDELPQLWNIARGDMSVIGPRPLPLELYAECVEGIPNYDWRHVVRPGLLGKAQVALGYTEGLTGERRKWALDREYIEDLGWREDGRIVLATLSACSAACAPARSAAGARTGSGLR